MNDSFHIRIKHVIKLDRWGARRFLWRFSHVPKLYVINQNDYDLNDHFFAKFEKKLRQPKPDQGYKFAKKNSQTIISTAKNKGQVQRKTKIIDKSLAELFMQSGNPETDTS